VMTGSVMKTVFPSDSATYRFNVKGLGTAEVHVTE
jgi:hypothetical protein